MAEGSLGRRPPPTGGGVWGDFKKSAASLRGEKSVGGPSEEGGELREWNWGGTGRKKSQWEGGIFLRRGVRQEMSPKEDTTEYQ